MPYVFSTLTTDQEYTAYDKPVKDGVTPIRASVIIRGRANIPDDRFHTPKGVANTVTDEQLELLKSIPAFNHHVDNGFIVVESKNSDPEKVAKNMTAKDKSAPITPETVNQSNLEVSSNSKK